MDILYNEGNLKILCRCLQNTVLYQAFARYIEAQNVPFSSLDLMI